MKSNDTMIGLSFWPLMGAVRKKPNNTTWYSSATIPPPTQELRFLELPILCRKAWSAGTAWSSTVCRSHCFNSPWSLTLTIYLSEIILIIKILSYSWAFPSTMQVVKHTEGRLFSLCQGWHSKLTHQFWHPKPLNKWRTLFRLSIVKMANLVLP